MLQEIEAGRRLPDGELRIPRHPATYMAMIAFSGLILTGGSLVDDSRKSVLASEW